MGFAIGVLNPLTNIASAHLNCSPTDLLGWPLIVSSFCPAGFIGSQLATMSMRNGLTSALNISCIICIFSNLLCGAAAFFPVYGFNFLLIGRIGNGIASGIGTVVSPVYFGDISPPHLRGIIGASYQLATVSGILFAQLIASPMATTDLYGWLLLSPTLFSLLQLFVAPFALVESPNWLRSRGYEQQAQKASLRLATTSSIGPMDDEKVLPTIVEDGSFDAGSISAAHPNLSLLEVAKDPQLAPAFFLLLVMLIGQQLCGINALFFYSTDFFKLAGLENPMLGTLMCSGVNVLAVAVVLPMLVSTARRKMMMWGLGGMLFSASILTAALVLLDDPSNEEVDSVEANLPTTPFNAIEIEAVVALEPVNYTPMVVLAVVLSFIAAFELSLGLVPWIIGTELFPTHAKGAAFSCASGANWFATFIIGIAFPAIQSSLGPYCFLPFIASVFLTLVICYLLLPETVGFSTAENLDHLHKKWRSFCCTS